MSKDSTERWRHPPPSLALLSSILAFLHCDVPSTILVVVGGGGFQWLTWVASKFVGPGRKASSVGDGSVAGPVRPFFLTAVTAVRSTSGGSADGLQELCARLQRLKHAQAAPQTLGKIWDFQKYMFVQNACQIAENVERKLLRFKFRALTVKKFNAVWLFDNCSPTDFLHEIYFGNYWYQKIAILTI